MNILVVNGSPKEKSDTMCLTRAFLDGIKKTGDHRIEIVDVIKHDIGPCVGCFLCWKNLDGRCVIKDYQNELLQKIEDADAIIWSFPLYCCGMPSHLKAVFDRMLPLTRVPKKKDRRNVVICGSGFPSRQVNFDALKMQCMHMLGKVRMICVQQTPLLNVPSEKKTTAPLLKRFTEAGEEFGNRTYLYRETVAALEAPMLSDEDYMHIAHDQEHIL